MMILGNLGQQQIDIVTVVHCWIVDYNFRQLNSCHFGNIYHGLTVVKTIQI